MTDNKEGKSSIEIDPSVVEEAVNAVDPKAKETAKEEENQTKDEVDYKDRLIRLTADFDNYRKRVVKEKTEYIKYGNEHLLKEILPILDNFERALAAENNADAASILKGVEMIFLQLSQTLEKFGLKSESTKGQTFDPNLHDAMSHVPAKDADPNTIVEEHQKLYRYHNKLLRPALVTVAKEEEENSDTPQDEEDGDKQDLEVS